MYCTLWVISTWGIQSCFNYLKFIVIFSNISSMSMYLSIYLCLYLFSFSSSVTYVLCILPSTYFCFYSIFLLYFIFISYIFQSFSFAFLESNPQWSSCLLIFLLLYHIFCYFFNHYNVYNSHFTCIFEWLLAPVLLYEYPLLSFWEYLL